MNNKPDFQPGNKKSITMVAFTVGLAFVVSSLIYTFEIQSAVASDRGELLYENHCLDCHGKNVHTREGRRVSSPEELRAWVMSWVVHSSLPWGQEEVADITAYLDRTFYHFTE